MKFYQAVVGIIVVFCTFVLGVQWNLSRKVPDVPKVAEIDIFDLQKQIGFLRSQIHDEENHRREMIPDIQLLQVHVQEQGRRLQIVETEIRKSQITIYDHEPFAWPISEADYRKAIIYNLHPEIGLYADKEGAHVHCTEELNGGGYRNGKFVYLKEVAQ